MASSSKPAVNQATTTEKSGYAEQSEQLAMANSAVAFYKAFGGSVSSLMAKPSSLQKKSLTSHKLPALGASSCAGSAKRIKCFYIVYDTLNEDPYSFRCLALNKKTGETTPWTISPASDTIKHLPIHMNYTAVALGSTIYMIGGMCCPGFCPVDDCHLRHPEVRYFDTLRPEDGWREAAPMHIARLEPAAVVVDGMIYVFGGSVLQAPEDGECFDPHTNQWHRFSAKGCRPFFACIQAPYVHPNGAQSILINSEQNEETLYAYLLDTRKWEIVSHDFVKCQRPGAIVGDIIYAILDYEEQPLHGYDLNLKRWFPVDLPELDAGTEICTKTVWVFALGSDRLCLLWYHVDRRGQGRHNRMECLELRLNKSYSYTGSGKMLSLTATKVSHTCFRVQISGCRKSIFAL